MKVNIFQVRILLKNQKSFQLIKKIILLVGEGEINGPIYN